jgi:hypothetical protein
MVEMDVDELYGLPLERFVPERGALARELRTAGRRDEAAEVTALRKPSVAAWAVNQLVRSQRAAVDELFTAGDRLRDAQSAVLAGHGDAGALRAGADAVRVAVRSLVHGAEGLLSSDGHELSPSTLERVAETLQAAALDADARQATADGRLERELRYVALGVGGGPAPARAPSRRKAKPSPDRRAGAPATRPTNDDAAAAARAQRERAEAHKRAQGAERDARRELDRANRALRNADQRRERATEALREADEELAAARSDAEAAEQAYRAAQKQLEAR